MSVQLDVEMLLFPMMLLDEKLKDQCLTFRGIYWQKWNIILISMFSLVYNHLKIRIVFYYLRMSHLYLHRERVLSCTELAAMFLQ